MKKQSWEPLFKELVGLNKKEPKKRVVKYPLIARLGLFGRLYMTLYAFVGGAVVLLALLAGGVCIPSITVRSRVATALWEGFMWFALLMNFVDVVLNFKTYWGDKS